MTIINHSYQLLLSIDQYSYLIQQPASKKKVGQSLFTKVFTKAAKASKKLISVLNNSNIKLVSSDYTIHKGQSLKIKNYTSSAKDSMQATTTISESSPKKYHQTTDCPFNQLLLHKSLISHHPNEEYQNSL